MKSTIQYLTIITMFFILGFISAKVFFYESDQNDFKQKTFINEGV